MSQRFPPDVAPVLHAIERDLHDARVGARDGFDKIGAASGDREHSPPRRDQVAIAPRRSGMIDRHAGNHFGSLDAADNPA